MNTDRNGSEKRMEWGGSGLIFTILSAQSLPLRLRGEYSRDMRRRDAKQTEDAQRNSKLGKYRIGQ